MSTTLVLFRQQQGAAVLPLLHPHPRQNSCPPHHLGLLVRKEHVSSCFLFPVFFFKDEDATEEAQLFKPGHMAKPGPDQNMAHSVSSTLTQLINATNQNTTGGKNWGKKITCSTIILSAIRSCSWMTLKTRPIDMRTCWHVKCV